MRTVFPLTAALVLAGCMRMDVALLGQVPVDSAMLIGNYATIANCAYRQLDNASGNGIKKIDLNGETRLALESGGLRNWELTFTPAGSGRTAVAFTQEQTMWGPLGSKEVMPIVRACGA